MRNCRAKKGILLLVSVVILAIVSPAARLDAEELDELGELGELRKQLLELQKKVNELEAKQKLEDESLNKKIDEVEQKAEQKPSVPDALKWLEKIKISGDFRYRHEHIDSEEISAGNRVGWRNGRDRDRIRARLMLEAAVNGDWDVVFRLATGERDILVETNLDADMFPDPISSNQTLKQNFSSKDVWIDLAHFIWHPGKIKGLKLFGGKIKMPFYAAGKNELIWDGDLNPEGLAVNYVHTLNENNEIHFGGAGLWVDESGGGADASLWGVQSYLKHKIGNPDHIIAGVTYLDYGNIRGKVDQYGILAGNTADVTGTMWASDYDLLEVFAEYGTKCWGMPVSLFGSWVHNLVAVGGQDTGWLVGATLNKASDPGTWQLGYNYREVESDAVFGAFTDSDFLGGGSNGRGHEFNFKYQFAKNVQGALTYFHNENDRGAMSRDLDYRRLQADLQLKF